jgi:hypothetical protein
MLAAHEAVVLNQLTGTDRPFNGIASLDHSPGSEGRPTTVAESTTGTRSPVTIRMRRRETHGNVAVAVQARANHGG